MNFLHIFRAQNDHLVIGYQAKKFLNLGPVCALGMAAVNCQGILADFAKTLRRHILG